MTDIISTTNVWPNYSTSNVSTAASKQSSDSLGKDQFLKILITQLQNQNPMEPLEDKEFIAQMAQFTSVEQLTNISSQIESLSQSLGAASGLIGKQVSWIGTSAESNESAVRSGVVDSIVIRSGVQYAVINDEAVALSDITQISEAKSETDNSETTDDTGTNGADSSDGASNVGDSIA